MPGFIILLLFFRPAMFQSHIIQSDLPRSLPQRVACHDMSVIAEQSILLDDILPPEDMVMHSTEGKTTLLGQN